MKIIKKIIEGIFFSSFLSTVSIGSWAILWVIARSFNKQCYYTNLMGCFISNTADDSMWVDVVILNMIITGIVIGYLSGNQENNKE